MNNVLGILNGGSARTKQAAVKVAAIGSTRLNFQLQADRINAALERMVQILYGMDKRFPHPMASVTYELLIRVPWSAGHYRAWDITATDRVVMFRLSQEWRALPEDEQLLLFHRQRWFLNYTHYPDLVSAQRWLGVNRVTVRMVRDLYSNGPMKLGI